MGRRPWRRTRAPAGVADKERAVRSTAAETAPAQSFELTSRHFGRSCSFAPRVVARNPSAIGSAWAWTKARF